MAQYDYIISLPLAPAFDDSLELMFFNIEGAGGTSPTLFARNANGSGLNNGPMPGTIDEVTLGKNMLYFRLPDLYTVQELTDMLYAGVPTPKPPFLTEMIRSALKIVNGNTEYDYPLVIQKDRMLPYLLPIQVTPGNPGIEEPTYRPPELGDDIYLGMYVGTDPVNMPPETP